MSQPVIQPALMAGGSGTRLWPLSRQAYPKQFVALTGEDSLYQQALLRVRGEGFRAPIILGHADHRFLLAEHARSAGIAPSAIILEPALRDTAPAACVAALKTSQIAEDALVLLTPCDHLIPQDEAFRQTILKGVAAAQDGAIAVFGVPPSSPHEGFGYIECARRVEPDEDGPVEVTRFVEKPKRETAEEYLRSRRYFWNAGIFLFRADVMLKAFAQHAPETLDAARDALAKASSDLDFLRLDPEAYARATKKSVDYAIMEKRPKMACVPLRTPWSDCGTWDAVREALPLDAEGNAAHGDVVNVGSRNCLTYNASNSCVVTLGLENVLTVATDDSILIATPERAADLKAVVERLTTQGRELVNTHRRVYRPWGWYEGLGSGGRYQVKCIMVKPGAKLSLQSHLHRAEHWIVVSGAIEVTCDDKVFLLREDQSTYIPVGAKHRMANPGKMPAFLIEVQSGSYLGEDDITRYDDVYGRAGPANAASPK